MYVPAEYRLYSTRTSARAGTLLSTGAGLRGESERFAAELLGLRFAEGRRVARCHAIRPIDGPWTSEESGQLTRRMMELDLALVTSPHNLKEKFQVASALQLRRT
jgi:hypothetical protein